MRCFYKPLIKQLFIVTMQLMFITLCNWLPDSLKRISLFVHSEITKNIELTIHLQFNNQGYY